jgi:RHS repeat-associated protein
MDHLSVVPIAQRNVYYAYDSHNRLTTVTDWYNRVTTYTYDLAGRMTEIVRPWGSKRKITYNGAGETVLIEEQKATGSYINYFKFSYDTAGRIQDEFIAPIPAEFDEPAQTVTHNADNQITTFNGQSVAHDPDGNMTYGPLNDASSFATCVYDSRNRLTSVGGLTYRYDSSGNRIAIVSGGQTTRYAINPNAALSQVLVRTRPDGSRTFYVYGLGLLYDVEASAAGTETGTRRNYHFDYRGSTVAISDQAGAVLERIEYSVYGRLTRRSGTVVDTPFLFNGQYGVQTDDNGLLHMRARYYNPHLCRFVNADPFGFGGGLNWYAFADENPVSNTDPTGYESFMFPPQYAQIAEFRRGFDIGMANAVPAGLGTAGAVFLGPVAGGATLSLGINTTDQLNRQFLNPSTQFSGTESAAHTVIGAAVPYGLSRVAPFAASLLPNSVKGSLGEMFSYVNGIFQGRGFAPVMQQQISVAGRTPIPDLAYPGAGTLGQTLYVEAKFGTSTLKSAQRAAANALGDNWITERWTYDWLSSAAGRVGQVGAGLWSAGSGNDNGAGLSSAGSGNDKK